jgi:ribonuclease HI
LRVTVHFDGGGPNPGPSACAAVVYDAAGNKLASQGHLIGEATNNIAEWEGLLLGVRMADSLRASHVELRGDSQLIINQLLGIWSCKDPSLRARHYEAIKALEAFASWEALWVRREANREADAKVRETLGDLLAPTGANRRDWKGAGLRLADACHEYLHGHAHRGDLDHALREYREATS